MNCKKALFLICGIFLVLWLIAEFWFRFDVLNRWSFGVLGWIFLSCLCTIVLVLIVIPFMVRVRLPKWEHPDSIECIGKQKMFVNNYADSLLSLGMRSEEMRSCEVYSRLRKARLYPTVSDEAFNELKYATIAAHEWFVGELGDEVITRSMKRAGFLVAISQRGVLDGLAMLYIQAKMVSDLADLMGYQKSWVLQVKCCLWLVSNSLVFVLLGDEMLDSAMNELVGEMVGEKLSGAIPFVGKVLSSVVQGAAAMATIYATGKMAQCYFAGQRKLTGRERISFRIEGLKKSANLQVVS